MMMRGLTISAALVVQPALAQGRYRFRCTILTAMLLTGFCQPTLAAEPTYTYADTNGHSLTGLACNVTDQGHGITDEVVACHSKQGGWTCRHNVLTPSITPVFKYVCTPWIDKQTGKQTDDPFHDYPVVDEPPSSPDKLAADRKKALLACNDKPTWLGVLFCRWDQR
jgi:hypothetical protein